jgi:hypothetical protein
MKVMVDKIDDFIKNLGTFWIIRLVKRNFYTFY